MKLIAAAIVLPFVLGWPTQGAQGPSVKQMEEANRRVNAMLKGAPKPSEFIIEYRPIRGLENRSQWHIGASHWWVRLHHTSNYYTVDKLDKAKKYRVTGIVLEQNYGVVEVWLRTISPLG